MIGKIMKAASFSRCVHYVTGKEDARILASDGVLLTTTQDIIDRADESQNLKTCRSYRPEFSARGQGQTDERNDDKDCP